MKKVANHKVWCSSEIKAAISLEQILNVHGEPHLVSNINTIFDRFDKRLKAIKGNPYKKYFTDLLINNTRLSVSETAKISLWPPGCLSHVENILVAKYRIFMK